MRGKVTSRSERIPVLIGVKIGMGDIPETAKKLGTHEISCVFIVLFCRCLY